MSENLPSTLVLVIADFRAMFPAFSNPIAFPDNLITLQFTDAQNYISATNYGILNGNSRLLALYKMTAHLLQLGVLIAENNGAVPGITTEARVGAVQVTLQPPPSRNEFQWWLNQTPYGASLLAQLKVKATGGFFIGGRNGAPLGGFRRADGGFWPGC